MVDISHARPRTKEGRKEGRIGRRWYLEDELGIVLDEGRCPEFIGSLGVNTLESDTECVRMLAIAMDGSSG